MESEDKTFDVSFEVRGAGCHDCLARIDSIVEANLKEFHDEHGTHGSFYWLCIVAAPAEFVTGQVFEMAFNQ
jgi:hypothetical protein